MRLGDVHARAERLQQLQRDREKAAAEQGAAAAKLAERGAKAGAGAAGAAAASTGEAAPPAPGPQHPVFGAGRETVSFAEGGLFQGVPTNFADVD